MPQVASEAATHAFKPAMPNPARAAPSSERAYGSPFDSLIDDGTQGPASQPPQSPPASADTTAAQPDLAKPPAKIEGAKATQANGDSKAAKAADVSDAVNTANGTDAGSAPEADRPVTNGKVPSDGKVKVDVNICEQAAAEDHSKPAGDSKPADGLAPTTVVADPATTPTQTITPAAALATAPIIPAASSEIPQAEATALTPAAPATLAQTVAAAQPAIVTAGTPKAKAVDPAIPQDDSGKPADDPKLSAKAAFDLQSNVKRNRQPATLTKSLRLHLLLDRCEFDQLLGWPDGAYTMTATATDASGQTTAISTQIQARMDSVDLTQNPPLLSINGQNYTVTQLQRIVAPGA